MSSFVVDVVILFVIFLVALLIKYWTMVFAARRALERKEAPIVPHFVPWIGHAVSFGSPEARDALIRRCRAAWGACFRLVLAGRETAIVADAELWRVALRSAGTTAGLGEAFADAGHRSFEPFQSRADSESGQTDPSHMRGIRTDILAADQLSILTDRAQKEISSLLSDETLDGRQLSLVELATRSLFRATVAALFGNANVAAMCDDGELLRHMLTHDRSMTARAMRIPRLFSRAIRDSDVALGNVVAIIRDRQAAVADERAKLIVDAQNRTRARVERGLSESKDIDTSPVVFTWVAVVNSFGAAIYTLWHIAKDQSFQERVAAEVRGVLATDSTKDGQLTLAGLGKLPLVDSAISETLRLHANGVSFRRTGDEPASIATKTVEINNIPPHMDLLALNSIFFRDEARFPRSDQWQGDRFLVKDDIVDMVFGGGAHLCPGRVFVRNELRQIVASIFAKFKVELVGGCVEAPMAALDGLAAAVASPQPGTDARIRLTRR